MKKRAIAGMILLLCLAACLRIYQVNEQYPQTQTETVKMGEILRLDDYDVILLSWEWQDSSILKEIAPGYSVMTDENGNDYPEEKERVVFAKLRITKTTNNHVAFHMENVALESGGWNNQWDPILYQTLNGTDSMVSLLKKGESREIIIPIELYDFQFHKQDWETVTQRQFCIVFENYPVKRMIKI